MPKVLNRDIFFTRIKKKPFNGRLTASQKQGIDFIIDVWEQYFIKRTPISQFAYCLGTTAWETGHSMQPVKEKGGNAYYFRMYDIKGARPSKARELGNINPGDGIKFCGMGFVQSTGRGNARKATKRLRELNLIDNTIDLEKNPELLMTPRIAAMVLFIGMEEGWFTGRTLDKIIDNEVDGDEHSDYIKARAIINGKDKAEAIADLSDDFLDALVAASKIEVITNEDKEIIKNKGISTVLTADDLDVDEPIIPPVVSNKIKLNKFEIKGVQAQLWSMGYKIVGKADGIWGKDTTAAVSALEKQAGLPITGSYNSDVKEALNNPKNKFIVDPVRANATVKTIRASGSKTIAASDSIKTTSNVAGLGLLATSAGSAVVEYGGDAVTWVKTIKETFDFVPVWVWPLIGLVVVYILWKQGQKVEDARVEDERTGSHTGLPTVLNDDEDSVEIVDPESEPVPKFLKKEARQEIQERVD